MCVCVTLNLPSYVSFAGEKSKWAYIWISLFCNLPCSLCAYCTHIHIHVHNCNMVGVCFILFSLLFLLFEMLTVWYDDGLYAIKWKCQSIETKEEKARTHTQNVKEENMIITMRLRHRSIFIVCMWNWIFQTLYYS